MIDCILGFILGIFIILFFKKQSYHGPDSNIIRNNIYYDLKNNKCFKLIPIKCSSVIR